MNNDSEIRFTPLLLKTIVVHTVTYSHGWLLMWWTLVGLGILSTFGPAPGSLEGMVFTTVPITKQLTGWIEVVPQAFLLSSILWYWVRNPKKRWISWTLGSIFVLFVLLLVLDLLVGSPAKPQ